MVFASVSAEVTKTTGFNFCQEQNSLCVNQYLPLRNNAIFSNVFPVIDAGVFIFPLEECSVVVGFEAMIGSQIISVQVKDKTKIDDCYFDCCHVDEFPQSGGGKGAFSFITLVKVFNLFDKKMKADSILLCRTRAF